MRWVRVGLSGRVAIGVLGVALVEPVAQPLERVPRGLVGHLGVDVHRERDAAMAQDQTVILAAAAYYAFTQVREAQRGRLLNILLSLREYIDSPESRTNRTALFNELPDDLTSPLTAEQETVVSRVVVEYENIASLVINGFIDFNLIADLYGNGAERSWKKVEPWIMKERALRNNATYAPNFEKFAKKCVEYNARKHGEELQIFRRTVKPSRSKRRAKPGGLSSQGLLRGHERQCQCWALRSRRDTRGSGSPLRSCRIRAKTRRTEHGRAGHDVQGNGVQDRPHQG